MTQECKEVATEKAFLAGTLARLLEQNVSLLERLECRQGVASSWLSTGSR